MYPAREEVYCHVVARQAVARAALHLGLAHMTEEALDTLASVTLSYLQRIGHTLSVAVEASGRSSAHVHVLDAIRAVELCTSPAVLHVHSLAQTGPTGVSSDLITDHHPNDAASTLHAMNHTANVVALGAASGSLRPTQANGGSTGLEGNDDLMNADGVHPAHAAMDPAVQLSWKGLAAFCFGPMWHTSAAAIVSKNPLSPSPATPLAPNPAGGWQAPFPDEIPPFPVLMTANQHQHNNHRHLMFPNQSRPRRAMGQKRNRPLLTDMMESTEAVEAGPEENEEDFEHGLARVPDQAFTAMYTGWGKLGRPWKSMGVDDEAKTMAATASSSSSRTALKGERPEPLGKDGTGPAVAPAASTTTGSTNQAMDDMDMDAKDTAHSPPDASKPGSEGGGGSTRKRPNAEDGTGGPSSTTNVDEDDDEKPAAKKLRFSNQDDHLHVPGSTRAEGHHAEREDGEMENDDLGDYGQHPDRPLYIPQFFPPFPRLADEWLFRERLIADPQEPNSNRNSSAGAAESSGKESSDWRRPIETHSVRSALVQLGQTDLWGSGWDHPASATFSSTASLSSSYVPAGRATANSTSDTTQGVWQPQIVPLGRASGSRVSRILEGSMDPATLPS